VCPPARALPGLADIERCAGRWVKIIEETAEAAGARSGGSTNENAGDGAATDEREVAVEGEGA